MNWPPRPHPSPCGCPECQEWARVIVSTPTPKKAPISAPVASGKQSTADFMRGIITIACNATGMTEDQLLERAKAMDAEINTHQRERDSRETVAARGVPEIHLRAVYDQEPVECDALRRVRFFLGSQKTTLVLSGGVGIRKTGSAAWALTQKPGVFVTASTLVVLSLSKTPEGWERWTRARNAQVLIVDDLGGEYGDDKGFGVKVFNELLDHRYSSALKTIVTTNLSAETFKREYGERVADRIRESGEWVKLGGKSVRAA